MGEFLFTIFYGGALVVMGLFTRWMLGRHQPDKASLENEKKEDFL